MAIDRLSEVPERVLEIQAVYAAAQANYAAAYQVGEPSKAQLDDYISVAQGVIDDTRALIRDLDGLDAPTFAPTADGAQVLFLMQWQRDLRSQLLSFLAGATDTVRQAREVASGLRSNTITAKDGDTWRKIAARELGDFDAWQQVLDANPDIGLHGLAAGVRVVIPGRR